MFRCKQFVVDDTLSAMKVSTDALILGSWASQDSFLLNSARRILDIGSGSGILSLMMLQNAYSGCTLDAIDIDASSVEQTQRNIDASSWAHQGQVHLESIADYQAPPYDVIISNPPYFDQTPSAANQSMSRERRLARHQQGLSWSELCQRIRGLSHSGTQIFVMYPFSLASSVIDTATKHGLHLLDQLIVKHSANNNPYLALFRFSLRSDSESEIPVATVKSPRTLVIRENNDYSPAFQALCKDFYLRF